MTPRPFSGKFRRDGGQSGIRSSTQIAAGNQNWMTQILGESGTILPCVSGLQDGAHLRSRMLQRQQGGGRWQTIVEQLYLAKSDRPGLRIKNAPFIIVGVLKAKGCR